MKRFLTLLAICAQMGVVASAAVGDKADLSSLENTTFYQHKVTAKDLQGKVVLVEYYGNTCGPCLVGMPAKQALYDQHKDKGFVLIASQCDPPNPTATKAYIRSYNLAFPICDGFSVPEAPYTGGVPSYALIGADGTVLAYGKEHEVMPKIEDALKSATPGAVKESTMDVEMDADSTVEPDGSRPAKKAKKGKKADKPEADKSDKADKKDGKKDKKGKKGAKKDKPTPPQPR